MIISLKISNFYSIAEEAIIDFTFDPALKGKRAGKIENVINCNGDKFLNIIGLFGGNAAGKSNFIKALEFCRNLVLNSHQYNEGTVFDFKPFKFHEDRPSDFYVNFIHEGIEYEYSFSITQNRVLSESLYYYPKKRKAKVFSRIDTDIFSYGKGVINRPTEVESNTGNNTLFLSRASSMNRTIARDVFRFFLQGIKIGSIDFSLSLAQIEDIRKNKELLLKALAVSDSDIVDIRIEENFKGNMILFSYHKENPDIPFDFIAEESDGTKRLFYILLLLIKYSETDTTIFWDEFDLRLHLLLTEFLINAIRNTGKSQLVFTSHNPSLINRENLRDDQIIFVNKLPNGSSEFMALSDFEGAEKIKDIQKAYLQGRFDGIPYTGIPSFLISGNSK